MKFTYINLDGNKVESEDLVNVPERLTKIDTTYFEKRVEVKIETKKEIKEEVKEDIVEENDTEEKALAFLKEKKVRGAHLLKGQKLIDRAISEGFNS